MLEHDDSDDFIRDIVDEMLGAVDTVLEKKYLERQIVPFMLSQVKDAVIQIVEVCIC
jgi:hypothetical protein